MEKSQDIAIHGLSFFTKSIQTSPYVCECTQREGKKLKMTAIGIYVFLD